MNEPPITDIVLYATIAYGVMLMLAWVAGSVWAALRAIDMVTSWGNRKSPEVPPEASPGSAHCGATATEPLGPRET